MSTKTKTKKTKKKGSKRSTYKGGALFNRLWKKTNPLQDFINMFDERLRKNDKLLNIMARIETISDETLKLNIRDLFDDFNLKLETNDEKIKQSFLILYLLMFILYVRIQKSSSAKLQGKFYEEYPISSLAYINDKNMNSLNLKLDKLGKIREPSSCVGCFDRVHFILIGKGLMNFLSQPNKGTFNENLVKEIKTLKELDQTFDFIPMFEEIPQSANPPVVEDSGMSANTRTVEEKAMDEAEKAMEEAMKGADQEHIDEAIQNWLNLIDSDEKYTKEDEKYTEKIKFYTDKLKDPIRGHINSIEDYKEIKNFKQKRYNARYILKKLKQNEEKNKLKQNEYKNEYKNAPKTEAIHITSI